MVSFGAVRWLDVPVERPGTDMSVESISFSCAGLHCKIKIFAQISESKIIKKWFVLLNSIEDKDRWAEWWIWTWFTAGWTTCIARTLVQTKSMCPIAITYAARIWSTLCNAAFQCVYTRIFALQSQVVVSMNESEIRRIMKLNPDGTGHLRTVWTGTRPIFNSLCCDYFQEKIT